MKRLLGLGVLFVLSLIVIAPAGAVAPDRVGKYDLGLNVSGALTEDELDSSVFVGGTTSYGVNEWFAIGLEVGWYESELELARANGALTDAGDVTVVPLLADFIFRCIHVNDALVPYGVLGAGVAFIDSSDTSTLSAAGQTVDVDSAFAFKAGAGLDWYLSSNWIANFEFSYTFVDEDYEAVTGAGVITDSADADYWLIGGGLKYQFD